MKLSRGIFVILVFGGLVACGSQPARDNFYSLMLVNEKVAQTVPSDEATAQLIVGPIRLANYLSQPGLAIQTESNQIQMANRHFWAESLDEAIAKVLVRDIANMTPTLLVDRDAGQWTSEGDCRIRVEFDKFHATSQSMVVVAGRYWLHQTGRSRPWKKAFDIQRSLTTDGYTHAVHQLRLALDTLAMEMFDYTQLISACSPRRQD